MAWSLPCCVVTMSFLRRLDTGHGNACPAWFDGSCATIAGRAGTFLAIRGTVRVALRRFADAGARLLRAVAGRPGGPAGQGDDAGWPEGRLRAVLDSLPCFVCVLERDGTVRQANRAAVENCGCAEHALIGCAFDEIDCWGGDAELRTRIGRAVRAAAAGRGVQFDAPLVAAGGPERTVELVFAPMAEAGGRTTHVLATATDITRRTRTEAALRLSEERFRTALRPSRILVFNQDRELHYTWVQDSIWGVAPAEVIGRSDAELFADRPDLARRLTELKLRVLDTGRSVREELHLVVRGRDYDLDVAVDPLRTPAGAVVGLTGAAIDVTERRRDEDALRSAREEAERANAAKTKFLAVASHDLRQPVQSLVLFVAALRDRLAGNPALPLVENLEQGLDALKRLLDGLLDISRLDSGRVAPRLETVGLAELLDRIAGEYGPRAADRGLRLTVRPTALWTRTDPALLERIVRNLLENALRYTRRGRVLVAARRRGQAVRLEVWDTGVGIAPDRLGDIFEEFTQVGEPAGTGRGLGLGLAIVRRLSRLLDHRVGVRSRLGRGSVFWVELPLVSSPRERRQPGQPRLRVVPGGDGARGLVVVVDDEAIVLMGLKAMLEGWGLEVVAAASGAQAVARLRGRGRTPVLILADYQLQRGETGPQAVAAVRAALGQAVPGVILTGDTSAERLEEVRAAGHRILHKPVFPSELRALITTAGAA